MAGVLGLYVKPNPVGPIGIGRDPKADPWSAAGEHEGTVGKEQELRPNCVYTAHCPWAPGRLFAHCRKWFPPSSSVVGRVGQPEWKIPFQTKRSEHTPISKRGHRWLARPFTSPSCEHGRGHVDSGCISPGEAIIGRGVEGGGVQAAVLVAISRMAVEGHQQTTVAHADDALIRRREAAGTTTVVGTRSSESSWRVPIHNPYAVRKHKAAPVVHPCLEVCRLY
mmetsp:Transcript_17885/g.29826  ORF Transcript_17885/g.29826 Transcript_17885/m.29826 type:complete len:223 (-) Transcript_17885:523-1191(-)